MTDMTPQKTALISVTDKTGLIKFAQGLKNLNFKILSTGGTARHLREAGIDVTDVAEFTGCPEVLNGRVKTLHPKIYSGLLVDHTSAQHRDDLQLIKSRSIDLLAVNLYNFKEKAKEKSLPIEQAIEHIDIGGPAMLRAAAKNHKYCLPVIDPTDYDDVLSHLKQGSYNSEFRLRLALKVFKTTQEYDGLISDFLERTLENPPLASRVDALPETMTLHLVRQKILRYGENAHQTAALYKSSTQTTALVDAKMIQGRELSYNNYLDIDAAASIIQTLSPSPALTIVKHTNPCGVAVGNDLATKDLFLKALASDPKCAFGGIIACNMTIDGEAALAMAEIFLECIVAPEYTKEALDVFRNKKNLRVLKSPQLLPSRAPSTEPLLRSIDGGYLVQSPDLAPRGTSDWRYVSRLKPDATTLNELSFAMSVCKNVKSNAIVLTSNLQTIGIGAGQMSRIDSVKIGIAKARELGHPVRGSVMASDAFFPFRDCVDEAAKFGITAIVQPGGSVRDEESIEAADEHGVIMVFTGLRHFKH